LGTKRATEIGASRSIDLVCIVTRRHRHERNHQQAAGEQHRGTKHERRSVRLPAERAADQKRQHRADAAHQVDHPIRL
jgi:hypothetical protein